MDWARCFSPGRQEDSFPPLPTTSLKKFTYKKLRKSTGKFNAANRIGEDTYKGTLRRRIHHLTHPVPDAPKTTEIIVRNLSRGLLPGDLPKCLHEIKKLETISHPNLVPLLGYCAEPRREDRAYCFLVFDVVKNGSAHDRLLDYDNPHKPISWERRIRIAIQTGLAMEHLHENGVMYRTFGSRRVLLDSELNVKLSYAVFPKLNVYKTIADLHKDDPNLTPETVTMFLSRAPELFTSYSTTKENDVYGFGVFLCELLMGKPLSSEPDPETPVLDLLMKCFSDRNIMETSMDPRLTRGEQRFYDPGTVLKMVTIAGMCLQKRPEARPSMKQINKLLDKISESKVEYGNEDLESFDH
ncbi:PREDICTED: probable receptor-like protein kinase At3g55450 [Ipomoea nil]|uniref:probable receptor-like protein kinase At3g55450 n=1 Tax=Ipomoea nil TaxID=35883 RepID=UPI000900A4F8|nr:PREDICTED: probable receptor-like protein kinase At3g55450 [Ipomoea nil]